MKIMTEQIKVIAERMKGLREIKGISAETLARELVIPSTLYSSYESGTTDIPVGFLYKCAQYFNVELSTLLVGDEPRLHVYSIVRKNAGVIVERHKHYKHESLAFNFMHKKAEPFMVTVEPSEVVDRDFDSHEGQEFNYVVEGCMKIIIDNHEVILNEGDSIYFNSSYKHVMTALNNKPVRFLAVIV